MSSRALLVGSRALRHWFKDSRDPAEDFDLFIGKGDLEGLLDSVDYSDPVYIGSDLVNITVDGVSYGFDYDCYDSVRSFMSLCSSTETIRVLGVDCVVADPASLMAIKRSHLYYRHNWHKHIEDYSFLKSKGVVVGGDLLAAMHLRMDERAAREDYKVAKSLNTSNDDFFARSEMSVRRKFVHDDLHLAVAYYDRPLFERLKLDHSRAKLEVSLFEQLSFEDKLRLVREEAYVIGLERIIIPEWYSFFVMSGAGLPSVANYGSKSLFAYRYAIMRICTDLTKGWFRDFAIENYSCLSLPDVDYVFKFEQAFSGGRLVLVR